MHGAACPTLKAPTRTEKKTWAKECEEQVYAPFCCPLLSQVWLFETHSTLKLKFRCVPLNFFFFFKKEGKVYKVNITFHCTMGFFNLKNISLSSLPNYLLFFSWTYTESERFFRPISLTWRPRATRGKHVLSVLLLRLLWLSLPMHGIELHSNSMFKMKHSRSGARGISLKNSILHTYFDKIFNIKSNGSHMINHEITPVCTE